MQIRDRIKELRRVNAAELVPNPKNWRTHPKAQQDALRGILAEVGMADAVLARELPDGKLMLIDGHLRTETVSSGSIPVLVLDVNEDEADKILATFDPLAVMAEKDSEQLASLLASLKEQNDSLASLVWPDYIVDPLLAADWTPPEPEELSGKKNENDGRALSLTSEQKEIVDAAIKKYRQAQEDEAITDADCVMLICQEYLDR